MIGLNHLQNLNPLKMKENSNKSLVINTLVLYFKLIVSIVCGLFITRYSLKALGVVDYGLYSVIGSIISFIAIINTIMVCTSQWLLAVSIGEGDDQKTRTQFNVCLSVHIAIAIVTVLLALPLGVYYITNYLNYDGNVDNAILVFVVSLLSSAFSFLGVPYNGLLAAKERFWVFCIPDVISHIIRLVLAISLVYFFNNKLIVYAVAMSILTVFPTIVYMLYCNSKFRNLVRFRFVREKNKYKEILDFSIWVGYGAVAFVGKSQGAAVLVNLFFNTVMNTAFGIANSLSSLIGQFAQSVSQPIAPQITKTYVSGNRIRCDNLLVLSTKLSFLVMLLISSPFLVECEWIINLWIGEIPEYSVIFTILLIVDSLIDSLNSGIKNIIFADGNIKLFQIIPSTLKLLSIILAYILLNMGYPPYSLLYSYIIFSVLIVVANQIILNKTVKFDISKLFRESYLPSLLITALFIPICFLDLDINPILNIVFAIAYLSIIIWLIGLKKSEKEYLIYTVKKYLHYD